MPSCCTGRSDWRRRQAVKIIETHQTKDEGKGAEELDERRRKQIERIRREALRNPSSGRGRQVALFLKKVPDEGDPSERMRRAIDSERGRRLYSQRIVVAEPVFANIRHYKGLDRFTVRGKPKVRTQWRLYCLVHNIEKLAAYLR